MTGRRSILVLAVGLIAGALGAVALLGAASTTTADPVEPDLIGALSGFDRYWRPDRADPLHGTVLEARTLARNDRLAVWINRHATKGQRFRALQDSEFDDGSSYDQSVTIADALGSVLGPIYVEGRMDGALPLTSALVNSEDGTAGAYVDTGAAKARFSYPRPFLPTDPSAPASAGDEADCPPDEVNASSLAGIRRGKPYARADGDLRIRRVPDTVDRTHRFADADVSLSAGYESGLCSSGSFPSGHTTTAYEAGITLATLLPGFAPEILARASEAGNDRVVLGVHYPLDVIGGRIAAEAAIAARWSDPAFRAEDLGPARRELVRYLRSRCGAGLSRCAERGSPYRDDPYGGRRIPGGTDQIVDDRASALAVYAERLTYGFATVGPTGLSPSVPRGAANLLLTAFPRLSSAQRTSVLAQTEIPSGFPLDAGRTPAGSWERLDLAAALSARVRVDGDGSVTVLGTGGRPATRSGR